MLRERVYDLDPLDQTFSRSKKKKKGFEGVKLTQLRQDPFQKCLNERLAVVLQYNLYYHK